MSRPSSAHQRGASTGAHAVHGGTQMHACVQASEARGSMLLACSCTPCLPAMPMQPASQPASLLHGYMKRFKPSAAATLCRAGHAAQSRQALWNHPTTHQGGVLTAARTPPGCRPGGPPPLPACLRSHLRVDAATKPAASPPPTCGWTAASALAASTTHKCIHKVAYIMQGKAVTVPACLWHGLRQLGCAAHSMQMQMQMSTGLFSAGGHGL